MTFTDSPYEGLMKELPGPSTDHFYTEMRETHPCYGCGNAMANQPCLLPCWKTRSWAIPRARSKPPPGI